MERFSSTIVFALSAFYFKLFFLKFRLCLGLSLYFCLCPWVSGSEFSSFCLSP